MCCRVALCSFKVGFVVKIPPMNAKTASTIKCPWCGGMCRHHHIIACTNDVINVHQSLGFSWSGAEFVLCSWANEWRCLTTIKKLTKCPNRHKKPKGGSHQNDLSSLKQMLRHGCQKNMCCRLRWWSSRCVRPFLLPCVCLAVIKSGVMNRYFISCLTKSSQGKMLFYWEFRLFWRNMLNYTKILPIFLPKIHHF